MFPIRILSLIVLTSLVFGSIFWVTAAQKMENSTVRWFDHKADGKHRKYEKISVSGFPNRLDLTIKNTTIGNYNNKFSVSTGLIQFLTLIYNRDLIISVMKLPIYIKYMNKNFKVEGDFLKSSFDFNKDQYFTKIVTEGSDLQLIDSNLYNWKVADFLFASENETTTGKPKYKSHLAINNITIPESYLHFYKDSELIDPIIKKLTFDSTIIFNDNFYSLPSLDKISHIEGLTIKVDWGLIKYSLTGNLHFSRSRALNGSVKIFVSNWQDLLFETYKKKLIDEKLFKTAKAGLTFIASQTKNGDQPLLVPLSIKNNLIFLGPLKLGKINFDIFI